jgi:hypothetical protein
MKKTKLKKKATETKKDMEIKEVIKKTYLFCYTEVNYNAGGYRNHVYICHTKKDAFDELFVHHSICCDTPGLDFKNLTKENLIDIYCKNCRFFIDIDNDKDDNYTRTYCNKCKKIEAEEFENIDIDLYCNICTYEKEEENTKDEYYRRILCDKCKYFSQCNECGLKIYDYYKLINDGENVNKFYSYMYMCGDKNYFSIDIFDCKNDYRTSWNC